MNTINLKEISFAINNRSILESISLDILANSFIQIKGSSGCGKSTLLKIIAGLIKPTNGTITINNRIANNPKIMISPADRHIGFLFQDLALWPYMKAVENIAFVLDSELNDPRIQQVCDTVNFPINRLESYPYQLSGGEKQRLALARALVLNNPILLLDEPYNSLDIQTRQILNDYLTQLVEKRQTTIILVSHDLMSDQVKPDREYLLNHGVLGLINQ